MKIGEIYKDKHTDEYIVIKSLPSGIFGKMEVVIVNASLGDCKIEFPTEERLIEYLKDYVLIN